MRKAPTSPAVGLATEIVPRGVAAPPRTVSAWSLTVLAAVAAGFALYAARELLQPIAAAFIVGVTLSPIARRLEALRLPRPIAALLIVAGVALIIVLVIGLVAPRISEVTQGLPNLAATLRDRLRALSEIIPPLSRRAGAAANNLAALFPTPNISWVSSTIGVLWPPIEGFGLFLVVLLLFISKWPDLRRGLVMTFASRDSRLTALRILNEVEAGLAGYMRTVTIINVCLGAVTSAICAVLGMPHALGFGALAAALNYIPFLGPIANFVVLLLIGVVAIPDPLHGLAPAAGFAIVVTVEGQFVTPTIVGRRLELNGLAVLLSLAFWAWLWGPIGAFLSSPFLTVALIVKQRLFER